MKKVLLFVWEITKIVVIALIIVIPVRTFIFQPFIVRGASMNPNFDNFDYLIVDQISYRFREPQRGDVVIFHNPSRAAGRFIKRIVGLPQETIKIKEGRVMLKQDGEFLVLDESAYLPQNTITSGNLRITLREDEYFVLGDNRELSMDSRSFGALNREFFIGRSAFRLWPLVLFAQE